MVRFGVMVSIERAVAVEMVKAKRGLDSFAQKGGAGPSGAWAAGDRTCEEADEESTTESFESIIIRCTL